MGFEVSFKCLTNLISLLLIQQLSVVLGPTDIDCFIRLQLVTFNWVLYYLFGLLRYVPLSPSKKKNEAGQSFGLARGNLSVWD